MKKKEMNPVDTKCFLIIKYKRIPTRSERSLKAISNLCFVSTDDELVVRLLLPIAVQ